MFLKIKKCFHLKMFLANLIMFLSALRFELLMIIIPEY